MDSVYGDKASAEKVADNCKDAIKGKVILTTGVTPGGIGATFMEVLANYAPKLLILTGRDTAKCAETAKAIANRNPHVNVRVLELDLSSQERVRKAAAEVNGYAEPIDVLCTNAGLMVPSWGQTKDGIETTFGINHIGHFLFANLIMNKLLASPHGARVVSVSSNGNRLGPVRFQDWNFDHGKTYDVWRAYGQSKTANNLFALSLAKKYGDRGLVATSVDPGVVLTNLMRYLGEKEYNALSKAVSASNDSGLDKLTMDRDLGYTDYWAGFDHLVKTLSQGAATHVYAAFDPNLKQYNGSCLADCKVCPAEKTPPWARDPVAADMLWKLSEQLVSQQFE
ncbi:MAG: hypothetical protein Q9191_000252 [Dirinaria sp. TL-2023a]